MCQDLMQHTERQSINTITSNDIVTGTVTIVAVVNVNVNVCVNVTATITVTVAIRGIMSG